MKHAIILAATALAVATPAMSQESSLSIDGIPIDVQRDDFIDRTVLIAPTVNFKNPDDIPSYGFLTRIISRGQSRLNIQGDFLNYSATPNNVIPYMRGGEPLKVVYTFSKITACGGGMCERDHHFIVAITEQQIRSHEEGGAMVIQFRNQSGDWKPTLSIPISYLNALLKWKP